MDAIYGVTKEMLAEFTSKYGELKAQYNEQDAQAYFDQYLQARVDPNQFAQDHVCVDCQGYRYGLRVWAHAHNAWLERFRTDPTGRLEAEFHMLLAQHSQRAHFGDVRDMAQDSLEGITLDQYAQIVVALSRQGADGDSIVRQFGLQGIEQWQRANAAWGAKMGEDTTHKLTMQYGQLYQKYAGPQFQEEQLQQSAAILAQSHQPRDVVAEPEVELTPDLCLQKMKSPSRNERWKYAQLYANMADLGNVPDKAAAIAAVTPILLEKIEQHDEHTTSDAEGAIRQLWDLGVRSDDIRFAATHCLNRATEKLTSLQAAFAPIQNQAVPERVFLQTAIQDYTSLVDTMREYLDADHDWSAAPVPAASAFAAGSAGPQFSPAVAKPNGNGFPKWIAAPILLLVAGGAFFAIRAKSAGQDAAMTATSASASPVPVASAAAPSASAIVTPPPAHAPPAHGSPAATPPKPPKKH